MKANELRIGNYVKTDVDDFYKITIEDLQLLLDDPLDDFYQEIPLIEEIRLKCGFIFDIFEFGYFKIEYLEENNVFYLNDIGLKLEYLHQLQNLYFALTGTELEFKNPLFDLKKITLTNELMKKSEDIMKRFEDIFWDTSDRLKS